MTVFFASLAFFLLGLIAGFSIAAAITVSKRERERSDS